MQHTRKIVHQQVGDFLFCLIGRVASAVLRVMSQTTTAETATGVITSADYCRWGPDASVYDLDRSSAVAENEIVTVLWQEGSFYYIEYNVGTNGRKRMFFPKDNVTITKGSVPSYTATNSTRFVSIGANTRYAPYNEDGSPSSPSAGSLSRVECVKDTGKREGNYALVTYDMIGSEGKKKRAWFPHANLMMPPAPSGSVYASVCVVTSDLGKTQKDANAAYICSYLMSLGFTKNAACGVLGNMEQESGINPGIWEKRDNPSWGYGLVQWTPATVFLNRAVSDGVLSAATPAAVNALASSDAKTLMDAELECLIWCCTARSDWSDPKGNMQHSGYTMTIREFMESTLPASTLAIIFHDHYERSLDSEVVITQRGVNAETWYNKL